jgi:phosphotransacetylase
MNKYIYKHKQRVLSAFQEAQDKRRYLNVWLVELEKVKHELAEYEKSIGFDSDVTDLNESEMEKAHVRLYYKLLGKQVTVAEHASELREAILMLRRIREGLYSSYAKECISKLREIYDHN